MGIKYTIIGVGGDGTYSGWIGPNASGATESIKHKWSVKGSYQIKVKAKDTNGAESPWSDPSAQSACPPRAQYTDAMVMGKITRAISTCISNTTTLNGILNPPSFSFLFIPVND